jgi:hypothetical protein
MSDSSKARGRPKLLAVKSGSSRISEYRQNVQEAGYLRSEVLIPSQVKAEVQAIAQDEGIGYIDALSAMVQLGIEAYRSSPPLVELGVTTGLSACAGSTSMTDQTVHALVAASLLPLSPSLLPSSKADESDSPIARFLRKRKT